MEVEKSKSRHESREERADNKGSPARESRDGRRKDKDHRSKDKEKDYDREKSREKDHRRDKEKERERKRDKEGDTEKEKSRDWDRERDRERDRVKDKEREKERDKHRDREKEKLKEKEAYKDKDRARVKDRSSKKIHEEDDETERPAERYDHYDNRGSNEGEDNADAAPSGKEQSATEVEERIKKMKEERKKKAEEASDALSWVARSRKIEEKRKAEKQRAHQLSRIFEEQDNLIQGENEDGEDGDHLSGVKVLHGLEKVAEGGAVILTLKDQSVLADGDVNNEIDMLENVEIGEQKRRNEAYEAAKKKKGTYDDKFNDDPGAVKKMLPQYDEPDTDEGIILDAKGRFTGEAEKKLEELRKRIQGQTTSTFEDLNSSAKVSSDYFSHEEMLRFKKPKKKKSLRKKDKLDISALEAEAIASGLAAEDLGSRKDGKRQALKEEKERSEHEKRSNAYQTAIAKADEASRLLRLEQVQSAKREEDEGIMLADDAEDLYKSLERARKLALTKKEEVRSGPEAIAQLLASRANEMTDDNSASGAETQENTVVFTEMNDFVWGLERGEGVGKPESEDVFMEEDEAPEAPEEVKEEQPDGWAEVKDTDMDEGELPSDTKEITPDETIHEVAVGKGLSGVLKLLKDRGALKEKVEWGGRNMDKKKSKLVGIVDDDGGKERFKDIRIERTDEFGRTLTPKEAFRLLSHKFHGKGPGKMKEEKRMKQYQEELKLKQMKNSDTPSLSVQRMREAQAQLKTPYIVLSGNVKPGQTSDPQSGFATVEKDVPGSLTPMLGDRKVEHFLGIKRQSDTGNSNSPAKRPKH
ncbi:SART-1 family protein DOT2 [Hirschfeldia incana]|nr:SART-1 family protein DOT2 [Hirschfeldia incana]